MVQPRIGRRTGQEIAHAAAHVEAESRLTPADWARWSAFRCPASYEIAPQADEWEPILGFAPDQSSHLEYGFMLQNASGQYVPVCRVLVDRTEPGTVVKVEWYPTNIDLRKRPN